MPFTFAHPAAVLPFKYLPKHWFSLTGLVIGSLTPDFEYFIRMRVKSTHSHTWSGLFWFDVPLGLLLVLAYNGFIKNSLTDHLPPFLYKRFIAFKKISADHHSFYQFIIIAISVLIGAATHIIWDGFTHPSGYFVQTIPMLSNTISLGDYHLYVYKFIQHTSTIIGLVIILTSIYRLPQTGQTNHNHLINYWSAVAVCVFVTLLIRLFTGITIYDYGNLIVSAIAGMLIGIIIASLATYKKGQVKL